MKRKTWRNVVQKRRGKRRNQRNHRDESSLFAREPSWASHAHSLSLCGVERLGSGSLIGASWRLSHRAVPVHPHAVWSSRSLRSRPCNGAVRGLRGRACVLRSVAGEDWTGGGDGARRWVVPVLCISGSVDIRGDVGRSASVRRACEFNSEWVFLLCDCTEGTWRLRLEDAKLYPERPNEADCLHYLKTGLCGYGAECRFNHPPRRGPVISI